MTAIINRKKIGPGELFVHAVELPQSKDKILGTGIDVMNLPEGHLCCAQCGNHRFECWVYLDAHRLECGCQKCGWSCRLLFPLDVSLGRFRQPGRFVCKRHPNKGFVIIHNTDTLSCGCELCNTEVNIKLRTESNLVLADA